MKHNFWAFSITLVLMILILLGPRHPGRDAGPDLILESQPGIMSIERDEPAMVFVGARVRLTTGWFEGCHEIPIEGQLNCALYVLNHPGLWFSR